MGLATNRPSFLRSTGPVGRVHQDDLRGRCLGVGNPGRREDQEGHQDQRRERAGSVASLPRIALMTHCPSMVDPVCTLGSSC